METSHAPFSPPPRGTERFFIGYIASALENNGQVSPEDWAQALRAADCFQRETEIDITNNLAL